MYITAGDHPAAHSDEPAVGTDGDRYASVSRSGIDQAQLGSRRWIENHGETRTDTDYPVAVLRNLETGDGAVASSSVEIPAELDSGLRLYPPLFLIPEKEAFYLRALIEQKKKAKREPLSISNIYPFLSNRHSPLVDTLEKGISKLFAIVQCSHRKIDKPKIVLSAHLTQLPSGEKTRLLFSILKTKKEKDTNTLLLEINLPEMLPGRYSLEMTAHEMTRELKSRTVQTFNVR